MSQASSETLTIAERAAEVHCPVCGHRNQSFASNRHQCRDCGSIWHPARRSFQYSADYPVERGHRQDAVVASKQRTLESWLSATNTEIVGRQVLEAGFGGGATLDWMHRHGAQVFGLEPIAANRLAAQAMGIPTSNIGADMVAFAGRNFDLALYLDSFEHIPDAQRHLNALNQATRAGSRAILVLPVADSLSRRLLRGWWPHDIEDHWIFYSTSGLEALWRAFGWRLVQTFSPSKCLTLQTIAAHWRMKTGMTVPLGPFANSAVWLNFGERGLVFERS